VDAAVQAAAGAFPAWRDTPVTRRVQVMFKVRELLDRHLHDLAVLLATEMGKDLRGSEGRRAEGHRGGGAGLCDAGHDAGDALMNVSRDSIQ